MMRWRGRDISRAGAPGSRGRQRGIALVLVMVALTVASALAVTFLASQQTTIAIASNISGKAEARAIAESGLDTAVAYVRRSGNWRHEQTHGQWLDWHAYAGGRFRVKFEDESGKLDDDADEPVTITAQGQRGSTAHQVQATVTPAKPGGVKATPKAGALVSGAIRLTGRALVDSFEYKLYKDEKAIPRPQEKLSPSVS